MTKNGKEYKAAVMRSMENDPNERMRTIKEIVLQKLKSSEEELKLEEIINHVGAMTKMEVDESIRGDVSAALHSSDGKEVIHTSHGYWKIK